MANNPYVNKVQLADGTSLIDISDTTAVASDVAQNKYFYTASGQKVHGTATGGTAAISVVDTTDTGGGTIRTITALDISDTTAVAEDVAQGKYFYTANGIKTAGTASGGGGSSWEFVTSKEVTVSTSSTSATEVEWWAATNDSSLWVSDKIVCVRIRDKAGKRNGYFFGSDTYFLNVYAANASPDASLTTAIRFIIGVSSSGNYVEYNGYGATSYGVYARSYEYDSSHCNILLQARYSSSYGTINGTYTVEVYLLSPPVGKPFFS